MKERFSQWTWLLPTIFILIYVILGVIVLWLAGLSLAFAIYMIVGVSVLFMAAGFYAYSKAPKKLVVRKVIDIQAPIKIEEKAVKPKGRPRFLKTMIWIIVLILVVVCAYYLVAGMFPPTCGSFPQSADYPNGVVMGPDLTAISLSLNKGECSPLIHMPVNSGFRSYSISSPGNHICVLYSDGSNSCIDPVNTKAHTNLIENGLRVMAYGDNTEVTVTLIR